MLVEETFIHFPYRVAPLKVDTAFDSTYVMLYGRSPLLMQENGRGSSSCLMHFR